MRTEWTPEQVSATEPLPHLFAEQSELQAYRFHPDKGEPISFNARSTREAQSFAAVAFHDQPGALYRV